MSQISPPIRILLVLTLGVMGAYMLFLRPKAEEIPPVEPVVTTATQPATKAAEQPAPPVAAAKPAEDLKGLPKPVRKAIRADKVLVVLFSNGKSYDDKAVEKALTKVNRWDGRVYVHTAPLRKISKYGRIARGVNVEQSPTVVVADRTLRAETLVGYVDRATIDQAVVDARRYSNGLYQDAYLKAADKVCFQYSARFAAIPHIYISSPREANARYAEADRVFAAYAADFKAIDPPAKWRSFHKSVVADLEARSALAHKYSGIVTPTMKGDALARAWGSFFTSEAVIIKRARERFNGANLPRCGKQF